jgi:Cu2+-exporting ATPase
MVGDGINDAAALSAATVGVAVHGGAEIALQVADVFLVRDGLEPLAGLLAGARRTMRVIRRNLAFSIVYNVVGAGLAMAGMIDPLVAAVLMPISSLTVITHSFRARTFTAGGSDPTAVNGVVSKAGATS